MAKSIIKQIQDFWFILTIIGTVSLAAIGYSYAAGYKITDVYDHLRTLDNKTEDITIIKNDINEIKISQASTERELKDLKEILVPTLSKESHLIK